MLSYVRCPISAIVKIPLDNPLRQWHLLCNSCQSAIVFTEISLYGISCVRVQQTHLSVLKIPESSSD